MLLLAACGGGGGGGSASTGNNNSSAGSGSPPGQAVIVNVSAHQTSSGIDIQVPNPASNPPPNVKFLGIGQQAFGTGAQIGVGQSGSAFMCGTGISPNMQVRISGPPDITVSNIRSAQCRDSNGNSTPGISFDLSVSSGAGLGGRTVMLINSQNDITTFTGGLEVTQ